MRNISGHLRNCCFHGIYVGSAGKPFKTERNFRTPLHGRIRISEMGEKATTSWSVALAAGGAAGTSVDVALFPLDTVKTRLQSDAGFWR